MVELEGREKVRSTLGFLESIRPLGATVKHCIDISIPWMI